MKFFRSLRSILLYLLEDKYTVRVVHVTETFAIVKRSNDEMGILDVDKGDEVVAGLSIEVKSTGKIHWYEYQYTKKGGIRIKLIYEDPCTIDGCRWLAVPVEYEKDGLYTFIYGVKNGKAGDIVCAETGAYNKILVYGLV
jgi:hypothetical protein